MNLDNLDKKEPYFLENFWTTLFSLTLSYLQQNLFRIKQRNLLMNIMESFLKRHNSSLELLNIQK